MKITGEMLIGASAVRGADATLRAYDPARNTDLEPAFGGGGAAEVARACELAEAAFDDYRHETLNRLEEEEREFQAFLERLRRARDKSEFDAFMDERRNRTTPTTGESL